MRPFLAAAILWSAVAVGLLLFNPGQPSVLLACMRMVGRSAACEAGQQTVNDASWWLHTLPLMATIAAGYIAVVILKLRGAPAPRASDKRAMSRG